MSIFKRIVYTLSEIFTQVVTSSVLMKSPLCNSLYVWTYGKIKSILEKHELNYFRSTVQPGMTVFDIGANIGFFTIEFARLVGPEGKVYAFEPDPFIFSLLKKNIERLGVTNVGLYNIAVSNQEGQLNFYVNSKNRADNRAFASPDDHREKIIVDAKPIDSIISPDVKVDFIKMDIQGYELFALQGMTKIISRSKQCILFSEFWPYGMHLCGCDALKYLEELAAMNFKIEKDNNRGVVHQSEFRTFTQSLPSDDFGYTNLVCTK